MVPAFFSESNLIAPQAIWAGGKVPKVKIGQ
jgi:hypothetical protein